MRESDMQVIRVAELFAGVGGFRLGLEGGFGLPSAGPFETVWANQWEPDGRPSKQFAWRCYESHFGEGSCVNRSIHDVLDDYEAGMVDIPDVDMVVGGYPCQSYSVARPLSKSDGIEGDKGVLWWDVYRFVRLKQPRYCLFENVDRLLKSPAPRRGRDFAIMLSCLNGLGYDVEWAVINSGEYGFPQRRRRVYILASRGEPSLPTGTVASALPFDGVRADSSFDIPDDPCEITETFNTVGGASPFMSRGRASNFHVVTCEPKESAYVGDRMSLGDVLVPSDEVPERFWIPEDQLQRWEYLKGAKREPRVARNGHEYMYSEGAIAYPDPTDRPSRTILTSEGGSAPSKSKHVVEQDGRLRRLVPEELELLQGFPRGWTEGMSDNKRAFCMGNALVTGVVNRIGSKLSEMVEATSE